MMRDVLAPYVEDEAPWPPKDLDRKARFFCNHTLRRCKRDRAVRGVRVTDSEHVEWRGDGDRKEEEKGSLKQFLVRNALCF